MQAASAEFVERGYDAARVSAIARRAGLTSGAVYARWPTKSDVMVAALEYIFQQTLPARRLEDGGASGMRPPDMLVTLGASLLVPDDLRDVTVQVFGSARNNQQIQECLQRFLNKEADQLSRIVEQGKRDGLADPELSTAAMSLLCQAVGIGTHLLLSAGLDDRHVPSEEEWNALITRLINAVVPPGASTP